MWPLYITCHQALSSSCAQHDVTQCWPHYCHGDTCLLIALILVSPRYRNRQQQALRQSIAGHGQAGTQNRFMVHVTQPVCMYVVVVVNVVSVAVQYNKFSSHTFSSYPQDVPALKHASNTCMPCSLCNIYLLTLILFDVIERCVLCCITRQSLFCKMSVSTTFS